MKLEFVQKCMYQEKTKQTTIIWTIIGMNLIFSILLLIPLRGYLLGQGQIKTKEQIQNFANSTKVSTLHYQSVIGSLPPIIITTQSQKELVLLGTGGGVVIPNQTVKYNKTYQIYWLQADQVDILLCSPKQLDLKKQFTIQIRNHYPELEEKIKETAWGTHIPENAYVFYVEDTKYHKILFIEGIILMLLFGTLQFLKRAKSVQKKTKLAKKIQDIGNYEETVNKINQQVKQPIYQTAIEIITQDYLILYDKLNTRPSKETKIIPLKNILKVNSYPHPKYPEEIIQIHIQYQKNQTQETYDLQVYDKESEKKVLEALSKGDVSDWTKMSN